MLRKLFFALALVAGAFSYGYSQVGSGSLQGTITDAETGEALPFANVVIENKGNQIAAGSADFDGKYSLRPIPPGTYDLLISYVGYTTQKIAGVIISSDQLKRQDVKLQPGIQIGEVQVISYKEPLVEIDKGATGTKVGAEEIKSMAVRSAADVAKTVGGVYSKDDGSDGLNIRGSRSSSSDTYIDGVKVIGSTSLPKDAIGEVSVITGGVPAQYGDVTGGLTIITTKEAIKQTFGSVEYLTSGFKTGENTVTGLDNYGYNLVGLSLGGPLFPKKDESGKVVSAPVGYLLSAELSSIVDPRGSTQDIYKVKDDVLARLEANPFQVQELGGVIYNAELLDKNDFETVGFMKNTALKRINLSGKLDFNTSETSKITVGGSFDYNTRNLDVRNTNDAYALYNWKNNPQEIRNDFRTFARFQQSFKNATAEEESESASLIKNAFFSVQIDYTKANRVRQNESHQDNFFNYGYVGKFESEFEPSFGALPEIRTLYDENGNPLAPLEAFYLNGFTAPLAYKFTPSDVNPILSNYNVDAYRIYGDNINTVINLVENGGLSNGRMPNNIYTMYSAPGDVESTYLKTERDQYRVSGYGSAEIKNHELLVGFEYEQRIERSYSFNPNSLWNLGRNAVNVHITEIDTLNYTIDYSYPDLPRVIYERNYNGESRTASAINMRNALGLPADGKDFIDFDSYDINTYDIKWFGADELINPLNGTSMSYYGFDAYGDKVNKATLNDFFNGEEILDGNPFKTRLIAPYQPIYVAGYIQDKFKFDDLILRVGFRVDRFDANQPVLKDQFSLIPIRTAGSIRSEFEENDIPSNIGDDFVVYTSNGNSPDVTNITGYRQGDDFYNANGIEINDPRSIYSVEGIAPWLEDPSKFSENISSSLDENSFKDYTPQVNVMPRISFSFPISDEATFFANYDILTQRPSTGNQIELINYLYLPSFQSTNITNNPNLKPEKTINYELGFKQALNKNSALTISTFYREQRDMIQVRRLTGAFPVDYLTYANIDFGTVKGATLSYDYRRTKNLKFRASYTIQFANGTGSGSTTAFNLVNTGQPNLRTILPYTYDQRHAITTAIDYRYGSGKNYNGPVINGTPILENFGVNLTAIAGSGTPYTGRNVATGTQLFSGGGNSNVVGDVNGRRLPFVYRLDARIDKDFLITWKPESQASKAKTSNLNVYIQILNLLDRSNVSNVYGYTGNAENDGYLASSLYANQIAETTDPESYKTHYNIKLNNAYNYELPRRIRLGLSLSF